MSDGDDKGVYDSWVQVLHLVEMMRMLESTERRFCMMTDLRHTVFVEAWNHLTKVSRLERTSARSEAKFRSRHGYCQISLIRIMVGNFCVRVEAR